MAKERELPEVLEIPFVICDNSVNRYTWRLLVEGIDLKGFKMNPVCCYQHDTYSVAVGKWKDVKIVGEELQGTVEFDRNDEESVKLYWKYKDGFMSAVSLNIIPLETSEDKKLLLPGQKCPTVTKSELLEISLVTIPGQKNAVKLSTPEGGEYKLNLITNNSEKMDQENDQGKENIQLKEQLEKQKKLNAENLIALHVNRGVVAPEEIESLKKLAMQDGESVSAMLNARKEPVQQDNKIEDLLKLHFERGAITEQEKPIYELSLKNNFEDTKKILEAKPGKEVVEQLNLGASSLGTNAENEDRKNWTYLDYFKKDPVALQKMEKENPEAFKKLELSFAEKAKSEGII